MNKPVWVLDTNVVLDLLHFDDAPARPVRLALEDGRVRCVVAEGTLEELRRVLTYPEFALGPSQQVALLARYQALCEMAARIGVDPGLPVCSDPDDQKFIELAAAVGAQALVSKDRAVLKLRRRCAPQFQIMTPAEAVRWLDTLPERADQPASCS